MKLKLTFADGVQVEISPIESVRLVGYDTVTGLSMLATNTFGNALVYQNNVKNYTVISDQP